MARRLDTRVREGRFRKRCWPLLWARRCAFAAMVQLLRKIRPGKSPVSIDQ